MFDKHQIDEQQHNELILRVGELVAALEQWDDPARRRQVQELLQSLDLVHREALHRLLSAIGTQAPQLWPQLLRDEVVQTLLLLYDFVPVPQEPAGPAQPSGFVPLSQIQPPLWIPIGHKHEFEGGRLVGREVEGVRLVLCSVGGRIHALENRCLDSILPLQLGRLDGAELICPWHGCRYELTTGRLSGDERRLQTFPVRVSEEGKVRVGLNVGAAHEQ